MFTLFQLLVKLDNFNSFPLHSREIDVDDRGCQRVSTKGSNPADDVERYQIHFLDIKIEDHKVYTF